MMSDSNISMLLDSQYFYAAVFRWATENPDKADKHIADLNLDELSEIMVIAQQLKKEGVEA